MKIFCVCWIMILFLLFLKLHTLHLLFPLNLNNNHNARAAINHFLGIPQKHTCHCRNYSMVFTPSKVWNGILRKLNEDLIVNFLHSRKPYFKDFSENMKIITELTEPYFVKLQFMVVIKIIHFVLF